MHNGHSIGELSSKSYDYWNVSKHSICGIHSAMTYIEFGSTSDLRTYHTCHLCCLLIPGGCGSSHTHGFRLTCYTYRMGQQKASVHLRLVG